MQGPQLPGMLSKLSGLFSSLQGNLLPSGLGPAGFSGQPSVPDQAPGAGLPGQDPNMAMLTAPGQAEGSDAAHNPAWRSFSDMMQVNIICNADARLLHCMPFCMTFKQCSDFRLGATSMRRLSIEHPELSDT